MPGRLAVRVLEAHGIADTEQFGRQDPYAVVQLTGEPQSTAATTTCIKGGTGPAWKESLTLPISGDSPGDLLVQLFNQNRAAPDSMVGRGIVSLDLGALASGQAAEVQVPLTSYPSNRQEGHVQLSISFSPGPVEGIKPGGSEGTSAAAQEPLPAVPGVQPTTDAALNPPEASDLRRLGDERHAYDRVHRPGYTVPPSITPS